VEVYVRCPLETCTARDQKEVYEKALQGDATTVPGLHVHHEPPKNPGVVVDARERTPAEGLRIILDEVERRSGLTEWKHAGEHR
jgi:adenylylsulfate kinase